MIVILFNYNKKIMCKQYHNLKAIIYNKRGMILSIGYNSYIKTHPWMKKLASKQGMPYKIYLHAEIDAILKCPDLSKAYRIQIIRLNKNGEPMPAKPCKICQSGIRATPIKVIEHT